MNKVISKLKAIIVGVCFVLLYYVVRPVNCFLSALLESRLMNLPFFKEVFLIKWEESYEDVDLLWQYVKELWSS